MSHGSILHLIQMRNFTLNFIFRLLSTLVNDDSEQRPNGDLPSLHKFSAHRAYWGQKLQDSQEQLVKLTIVPLWLYMNVTHIIIHV